MASITKSSADSIQHATSQAFRLPRFSTLLIVALLLGCGLASMLLGAAQIPSIAIIAELLHIDSGLTKTEVTIIWQWRLPRVLLGMLVGASLALAGAAYQGVFRNPLADPFLLGAAAGAGLGATLAIVSDISQDVTPLGTVPVAAFIGALVGVSLSAALGRAAGRSTAALLLAGVATAAFLTACQTFLMHHYMTSIQAVYSWIIGRLVTSGWNEVNFITPYFVVGFGIILLHRRELDLLRLGDDEAVSLGGHPRRSRLILILAASLLTASAVSVSGLIAFVGIVVPHLIRLTLGSSYRIIVPLSAIAGGAFLCLADLLARNILAPAELPIGVITAFVGAPFFALILRLSRQLL
jgi:iron complex transport system permease protein